MSKTFDHTQKPGLSVQVSLAGLSFLVKDTEEKRVLYFEEITFPQPLHPEGLLEEVKKIQENSAALQQEFSTVKIVHQNKLFAWVPKDVFREDNRAGYLQFTAKVFPTDYIDHDALPVWDLVNVYVPYTNINNYFFDRYGSFDFHHHNTVFVQSVLGNERVEAGSKMYAHLFDGTVDVLVTENKKLRLCNSFDCGTPEDFIYYLLFVAEQLEMNPETFPLQLLGKVREGDPFYNMAYAYVRNVSIHSPNNKIEQTDGLPQDLMATHQLLINA